MSPIELLSRIQHLAQPLEVRPTGVEPRLQQLDGIRAVVFDIYGTLIISGSGDVGTATASPKPAALTEAATQLGITIPGDASSWVERFHALIVEQQDELRSAGTRYPEIEIRKTWSQLIEESGAASEADWSPELTEQLAVEYEMRVNPTWPMPSASDCLSGLKEQGLVLGVVSNAQFFTPVVMHALFGASLEEMGFQNDRLVYSFAHLKAKPGEFLYQQSGDRLAEDGISSSEILYVGNDMLNDITPAHALGFRTALFAGDARSLRLREKDERVAGITPDLVLTDLAQILHCVLGRRN